MTNAEWNDFWCLQLEKNKAGTAKYSVASDPDTPEEAFMRSWIEKWREHFSYFYNAGCGCCLNIYEFDAPEAAIDEIPRNLIEVATYEELHRPKQTGRPSSFREFSRSIKHSDKQDS